jgi:GNAT superfamily N-acetyltransferase
MRFLTSCGAALINEGEDREGTVAMPEITIRSYAPADLERCRSLWAEMTQHHRDIYNDPAIGGEDPGLEFDAHLNKVGAELVWVACIETEVVGLTALIHNGEEAEIEPVAVSGEHRGKGVGRALVEHATSEAARLGVLCLSVKPVARNTDAIAFFHEAGFKIVGHIQLFKWLGPAMPDQWHPGLELFERSFDY